MWPLVQLVWASKRTAGTLTTDCISQNIEMYFLLARTDQELLVLLNYPKLHENNQNLGACKLFGAASDSEQL